MTVNASCIGTRIENLLLALLGFFYSFHFSIITQPSRSNIHNRFPETTDDTRFEVLL